MDQMEDKDVILRSTAKLAIVAFGQAGAKLAVAIAMATKTPQSRVVAINSAESDFRGTPWILENNRIPLDKNVSIGAGKNREFSKSLLSQNAPRIVKEVSERFGKDFDILFCCYSADGGTGSGIGPLLSTMFSTDNLPKHPGNVPVISICALPDHSADAKCCQNALTHVKELNNFVKGNHASIMLVDNEKYTQEYPDNVELRWNKINEDVAELIDRYVRTAFVSSSTNLDFADRNTMLATPGIHALVRFDAKTGEYKSPFVLPEGAAVLKMAAEMPAGTDVRVKLNNSIGCTVNGMSFLGLYQDGIPGAYPVAHYAGFKNIDKIVTRYQGWFTQKEQETKKQMSIDNEKSSVWEELGKNEKFINEGETIQNENEEGESLSFDDLLNISNL